MTGPVHTFTVPLPSPLWTPNKRVDWRGKAAMVKRTRAETYLCVCSEMTRLGIRVAERDEVRCLSLTLLLGRGQRIRDYDSVVACLKPCLDAMSRPTPGGPGALLIADDDPASASIAYLPSGVGQERSPDGRPGLRIIVGPIALHPALPSQPEAHIVQRGASEGAPTP